jgi:UDP-N-acetylglucosamine 3-dehydrogenase
MIARGILVGLGRMGGYHLRVLSALAGVEVVAVVDPSPERRATVPEGIRAFGELGEALSAVRADFACVSTPARALAESAQLAIEAGLAVLVEKPMAVDEESATALVAEAHRCGTLLAVGLVERCNPAVEALRALLAQDTAGRIYQMHARRLSPYPARESPVGVALDLATHDLDVIRYVTGSEVDRVYAETAGRAEQSDGDLVSATLRLDSGTTGIARREPLVIQWERFLTALRGEGEPAASGADGLAALSIARAVEESGRFHGAVRPGYREILAS